MKAKTYLELFERYGLARSTIYMVQEEDMGQNRNIFDLFDEVSDMITDNSAFNDTLPREFIVSMKNYNAKIPETIAHFDNTEHRAFYLSDLYDYLLLLKKESNGK